MPLELAGRQLEALAALAESEGGAWGRALADGTAEAYSAHRGGLRRFVIDRDGDVRFDGTVPPTERFRRARIVALAAVLSASLGFGEVVLLWHAHAPVGPWWLWPAISLVAAFLVAAAFFGIHARLPPRRATMGAWVGLPSSADGDGSNHTMPGLVKEQPIFAGFWLAICVPFGSIVAADELHNWAVGALAGLVAWWALMLCLSRGWITEGD